VIKPIYQKMLSRALPYYSETNSYVIPHIYWMMRESLSIINKIKVDESIYLPLLILHDIGYSKTCRNPFFADSRIEHMKAGQRLSLKVLQSLGYPELKSQKVSQLVGEHDRFAFGEDSIYQREKELGIFDDLHYSSTLSDESFSSISSFFNDNYKKVIEYFDPEISQSHTFRSDTTKEIHNRYLTERKFDLMSR
jgi:hypothetical protein